MGTVLMRHTSFFPLWFSVIPKINGAVSFVPESNMGKVEMQQLWDFCSRQME